MQRCDRRVTARSFARDLARRRDDRLCVYFHDPEDCDGSHQQFGADAKRAAGLGFDDGDRGRAGCFEVVDRGFCVCDLVGGRPAVLTTAATSSSIIGHPAREMAELHTRGRAMSSPLVGMILVSFATFGFFETVKAEVVHAAIVMPNVIEFAAPSKGIVIGNIAIEPNSFETGKNVSGILDRKNTLEITGDSGFRLSCQKMTYRERINGRSFSRRVPGAFRR
jgi:hypothetical protein